MKNIAVVVPTIRPEIYELFLEAWRETFEKYNVELVTVWDGDIPEVEHNQKTFSVLTIMEKYSKLIYNFNDGVRNLGFAYVAKYLPHVDILITLDDDVRPLSESIQPHLDALSGYVSTTWISTTSEYTRGFPYGVRNEAEVVLSHGVWEGVKDWDAPTQLVKGNPDVTFYKGPIPKNIFYPMCAMNLAFKRKMIPFMYQAPMGHKIGLDRFADIWCGIESKKIIDILGWAAVSGYSKVKHDRASNVFTNLVKEAKGIGMNEKYGEGEYFKLYQNNRNLWRRFCDKCVI